VASACLCLWFRRTRFPVALLFRITLDVNARFAVGRVASPRPAGCLHLRCIYQPFSRTTGDVLHHCYGHSRLGARQTPAGGTFGCLIRRTPVPARYARAHVRDDAVLSTLPPHYSSSAMQERGVAERLPRAGAHCSALQDLLPHTLFYHTYLLLAVGTTCCAGVVGIYVPHFYVLPQRYEVVARGRGGLPSRAYWSAVFTVLFLGMGVKTLRLAAHAELRYGTFAPWPPLCCHAFCWDGCLRCHAAACAFHAGTAMGSAWTHPAARDFLLSFSCF